MHEMLFNTVYSKILWTLDIVHHTVEEQATVTSVFLILLRIRIKLLETDQRLACEGNNTRPHDSDICMFVCLYVCF